MKAISEAGATLTYLGIDLLQIYMGQGPANSTFCSSQFLLWSHLSHEACVHAPHCNTEQV